METIGITLTIVGGLDAPSSGILVGSARAPRHRIQPGNPKVSGKQVTGRPKPQTGKDRYAHVSYRFAQHLS